MYFFIVSSTKKLQHFCLIPPLTFNRHHINFSSLLYCDVSPLSLPLYVCLCLTLSLPRAPLAAVRHSLGCGRCFAARGASGDWYLLARFVCLFRAASRRGSGDKRGRVYSLRQPLSRCVCLGRNIILIDEVFIKAGRGGVVRESGGCWCCSREHFVFFQNKTKRFLLASSFRLCDSDVHFLMNEKRAKS